MCVMNADGYNMQYAVHELIKTSIVRTSVMFYGDNNTHNTLFVTGFKQAFWETGHGWWVLQDTIHCSEPGLHLNSYNQTEIVHSCLLGCYIGTFAFRMEAETNWHNYADDVFIFFLDKHLLDFNYLTEVCSKQSN